eukprot:g1210.t1
MLKSLEDAIETYPQLGPETKFWIDISCLRQAKPEGDFNLEEVRTGIHETPILLVELDDGRNQYGSLEPVYLQRKFCVFEAFAACDESATRNGVELLVGGPAVQDIEQAPLVTAKWKRYNQSILKSATALCRSAYHTKLIDEFIDQSIGHAELDKRVSAAISQGVAKNLRFMAKQNPSDIHAAGASGLDPSAFTDKQLQRFCSRHRSPKAVTSLSLSQSIKVTTLKGIGVFCELQVLRAVDCNKLISISALAGCTQLQELDLCACRKLENIVPLGKVAASLRVLSLRETQVADLSVLKLCTSLEDLCLQYCRKLSDVSAISACTSLRKLNMASCRNITDISPIGSCVCLEELDLSNAAKVSDITMLSSCVKLVRIDAGYTRVTEDQQDELKRKLKTKLVINGAGSFWTLEKAASLGFEDGNNENDSDSDSTRQRPSADV